MLCAGSGVVARPSRAAGPLGEGSRVLGVDAVEGTLPEPAPTARAGRVRAWARRRGPSVGRASVAAGLAVLVVCLAGVIRRTFPFGPLPRSINDLGAQFVPMHALWRDVLTGQAPGDLFFNWSSGYGVPFLADYVTYLSSPFAFLVVLFPRDRIELAVFVITLLKTAAAATAMYAYLRGLRRDRWLVAAALAAAYATCGWAIDDASYVPMWLDGLIALPLFALVGEWAIRRQRFALSVAVVAVMWWANFYTAFMATLGAGVLVLLRLVVLRVRGRDLLATVLRFGAAFAAGMGLVLPALVPLFRAVAMAHPTPGGGFARASVSEFFGRLLPATEGVGVSPGLYVTTACLLLAVTVPWNGRLPAVIRVAYPVTGVLLVASFQWAPTQAMWHGFDTPDGSPYRQAFVLAAFLVVTAWVALDAGLPGPRPLAAAVASMIVLAVVTRGSTHSTAWTLPALAVSSVVLIALLAPTRGRRLAGVGLVVLVVAEGTLTAVVVDELRLGRYEQYAPWGAEQTQARQAVVAADDWPAHRTAVQERRANNLPMLLGGQGGSYYSSTIPDPTQRAVAALGATLHGYGRALAGAADPGLDPLLGVGVSIATTDGEVRTATGPSVPLVTLRDDARSIPAVLPAPGAFANRNTLWGADVYTVPEWEAAVTGGELLPVEGGGVSVVADSSTRVVLTAQCAPGTIVQMDAPVLTGTAQLAGGAQLSALSSGARGAGSIRSAGPLTLGEAPASGEVVVTVAGSPAINLPAEAIGCLDLGKRDARIAELSAGAPAVTASGHAFRATWPEPAEGTAVASVTLVRGWQCSTGGAWTTPGTVGGFIAVPVDGATQLSCRYQPPGLRLGLAGAAATGLALATGALAWALWRRRRPAA